VEELDLWLLDEADIDRVAAVRAPAPAVDGVRLVELQIGSSIGASKVWLLGRQFATRDDLDQQVLALGFEIGDPIGSRRPSRRPRDPAIRANHAWIPVIVETPPQRASQPLGTGRVWLHHDEGPLAEINRRHVEVPDGAGSVIPASHDSGRHGESIDDGHLAVVEVVAVPIGSLARRVSREVGVDTDWDSGHGHDTGWERELVGDHHPEALAGNGREPVRGAIVHATAGRRKRADPRAARATRHAGRSRLSRRLGVGRKIAARARWGGRHTRSLGVAGREHHGKRRDTREKRDQDARPHLALIRPAGAKKSTLCGGRRSAPARHGAQAGRDGDGRLLSVPRPRNRTTRWTTAPARRDGRDPYARASRNGRLPRSTAAAWRQQERSRPGTYRACKQAKGAARRPVGSSRRSSAQMHAKQQRARRGRVKSPGNSVHARSGPGWRG